MALWLSRLIPPLLLFSLFTLDVNAKQPIFDVHIHYSHDVWDELPPHTAIARLQAAGISRALVSSSGDAGTRRMYNAAPDLVIPSLRPYRKREDMNSWMHDPSVIPYLEQKLAEHPYAAIGEFHLDSEQADLPVARQMVQLARKYNLILHAHADADAIIRLFDQYPDARILWAHAGFEYSSQVEALMDNYPNLWADLSFRWEIYSTTRFFPGWEDLLIKHADRFMLGVDTYTPQRWDKIQDTLDWYERLFSALPDATADKIRYQNAQRLIGQHYDKRVHTSPDTIQDTVIQ